MKRLILRALVRAAAFVLLGVAAGLLFNHAPVWLLYLAIVVLLLWFAAWVIVSGGRIDDDNHHRND